MQCVGDLLKRTLQSGWVVMTLCVLSAGAVLLLTKVNLPRPIHLVRDNHGND